MIVVSTAGHVDHGKSTLLRALTGMEPDRWAEERERGLTIDLGFVWLEEGPTDDTLSRTIAFVDVPGHRRFIGNMLAGAGAADHVLFTVAADGGWEQQSQEHLEIVDLLGIRSGIVAITRTGLVGAQRIAEVRAIVEQRTAGTSLADAPVVATDAVDGTGLPALREELLRLAATAPPPHDAGLPRLWVDRSFTITGAGTVVTGTLAGGRLRTGDAIAIEPAGVAGRVRGLQALGRPIDEAAVGSRVAVNLAGVDRGDVVRGDAVVTRSEPRGRGATAARSGDGLSTQVVDVVVRALEGRTVTERGAWHLHVGTADVSVRVRPLDGRAIRSDAGVTAARLHLAAPLPLRSGDRLVLRDAGRRVTAGGGEVVDPFPTRRPRGTGGRRAAARLLGEVAQRPVGAARLSGLVELGGGVRDRSRTYAAVGAAPTERPPAGLTRLGDHLATAAAAARWTEVLVATLQAAGPQGRPLGSALGAVTAAGADETIARAVLERAVQQGRVVASEGRFILDAHAGAASDATAERAAALLDVLAGDPLSPPRLADACRAAAAGPAIVQRLVQQGRIVRVGEYAFTRDAVERAVTDLRELETQVGPFTAAQAKRAWGSTRRTAIPLLEYLDGAGVTAFDGTYRRLRGPVRGAR